MNIRNLPLFVDPRIRYALAFAVGLVAGVLVERGLQGRLEFHTVVTAGLAVLFLVFLGRFFLGVQAEGFPMIEGHWGGLGGSMTGWRVSRPLLDLVVAAALGLALSLGAV